MPRPKISDVLRDMNTVMQQQSTVLSQLSQQFQSMADPVRDMSEYWRDSTESLEDMIDNTSDYIELTKKMYQAESKLRRLDAAAIKDKQKMVEYLRELARGQEKIQKITRAGTEEHKRAQQNLEKINKILAEGLDFSQEQVKTLEDMGVTARAVARDVGKIATQFQKFDISAGFTKSLAMLERIGLKGNFKQIEAFRQNMEKARKEADQIAKVRLGKLNVADGKALGEKYRTTTDKKGLLRDMTAEGIFKNKSDRLLSQGLMKMAGGTGRMGKMASSVLGAGGGSAMGGVTAMATRLAGPAAIIAGVLELLQQGFDRNKEVYNKLGGSGLIAGRSGKELSGIYGSWSKYLTPGVGGIGFNTSFENNLKAISAIGEAGVGVSGFTPHLSGSMSDIFSGPQKGLPGSILRNEYLFGKNLGLGEGGGAALTMKLMKEFNLSLGGVEDMFKKLNMSVRTTGLTTTSYLNLLDNITSSFDKMAKAIQYSSNLINILGKNAKYTAEDLGAMIKSVMGERKDLTMGTFAFQQMGAEGRREHIGIYQRQADISRSGVQSVLGLSPEEVSKLSDFKLRQQVDKLPETERMSASNAVEQYIRDKNAYSAMKATGGDALRMAGVTASMNSPFTQAAQQMSLIQTVMKQGGGRMSDLTFDSQKVAEMVSRPEFAEKLKVLGVSPDELVTNMSKATAQVATEFQDAYRGDKKAQNLLGLDDTAMAKFRKMSVDDATKAFLNDNNAISRAINVAQEDADKKAEELAKKNQAHITSPLDAIKDLLQRLIDNIVNILQKLTKLVTFFTGDSVQKQAQEEKDLFETWNKGDGKTTTTENILAAYDRAKSVEKDPSKVLEIEKQKKAVENILTAAKTSGINLYRKKDLDTIVTTLKQGELPTMYQLALAEAAVQYSTEGKKDDVIQNLGFGEWGIGEEIREPKLIEGVVPLPLTDLAPGASPSTTPNPPTETTINHNTVVNGADFHVHREAARQANDSGEKVK